MNRNSIIFIQENAIENVVCHSGSYFSRGDELTGVFAVMLSMTPDPRSLLLISGG